MTISHGMYRGFEDVPVAMELLSRSCTHVKTTRCRTNRQYAPNTPRVLFPPGVAARPTVAENAELAQGTRTARDSHFVDVVYTACHPVHTVLNQFDANLDPLDAIIDAFDAILDPVDTFIHLPDTILDLLDTTIDLLDPALDLFHTDLDAHAAFELRIR